jgi:hypothetical protein
MVTMQQLELLLLLLAASVRGSQGGGGGGITRQCAIVAGAGGNDTLRALQLKARQALAGGAACAEVKLGSRRFELPTPLQLAAADSRTRYVGDGATISGAVRVPAAALAPLSAAQRKLFKPSVADRVRAIALPPLGVEPGDLKPLTYAGGNACIMATVYRPLGVELFHSKRRMHMARWPQLSEPVAASNWARIISANSSYSASGENWSVTPQVASVVDSPAQLASWRAQVASGGQVYTHGLWSVNWADTHRQVQAVETFRGNSSIARLSLGHSCPAVANDTIETYSCDGDATVTTGNTHGGQGGHFYVYNSLYDLDAAGEYVVDHTTATVFVLPFPQEEADEDEQREEECAGSGFYLTKVEAIVSATGVSNVSFEGVALSGSRGSAVRLRDCEDVVIRNASIRQVGLNALNVTGGARCGLSHVNVSRAGQGCVALEGGNRTTLTRSDHFVNDSRLVDCQRWTMNYAPNVLMAGVGQSVSRSLVRNCLELSHFQSVTIINLPRQARDKQKETLR